MLLAGSAWAFTALGPSNVRAQATSARPSLPIPPELRADAAGTIKLDARTGTMRFLEDRDTTTASTDPISGLHFACDGVRR
jgi:blue copper oxidase